jgi:hypothetical protein
MKDDDAPRNTKRRASGEFSYASYANRKDQTPRDQREPLPRRAGRWLREADQVAAELDQIERLRTRQAELEEWLENRHRELQYRLDQNPTLKRAYMAFIGSNAGRTGTDFKNWIEAVGGMPRQRTLKLVVDNEPPIKRVRIRIGGRHGRT